MKTKLLIVDDSRTSRMLFRINLPPSARIDLREAEDCASAIRVASEQQPDLVVLDYNMPDKNGIEVATELRAAGITADMVLLSANTQASVIDDADAAGFSQVVQKPVNPGMIANILADA